MSTPNGPIVALFHEATGRPCRITFDETLDDPYRLDVGGQTLLLTLGSPLGHFRDADGRKLATLCLTFIAHEIADAWPVTMDGPNKVRPLFPDLHDMGFPEVLKTLLGQINPAG